MSYFLGYVTKSLRHHEPVSFPDQRQGHRASESSGYSSYDDDDDSALVVEHEQHSPLMTIKESKQYGATGGNDATTKDEGSTKKKGFADPFVDWTHSQESLFRAFFAFFMYVIVAILLYSYILEDWPIVDSMYFAVSVFTTVGYGDLAPTSDISRLFTIAFASCGIIILGIFLGIIGTRLFELREQRVSVKLQGVKNQVMTQFGTKHKIDETGAVEVSFVDDNDKKKEAKKADCKKEEDKLTFAKEVWQIIKIEIPMILVLVMLSSPVVYLEGWDVIMGVYWMFVTGTTIGFGDLSPTHTLTKAICIVYLPLAAAVFGEMLAQIAGAYIERCSDEIEDAFLDRALDKGDLEKMDLDNNDIVKPYEFLSYMLVTLGKVGTF